MTVLPYLSSHIPAIEKHSLEENQNLIAINARP